MLVRMRFLLRRRAIDSSVALILNQIDSQWHITIVRFKGDQQRVGDVSDADYRLIVRISFSCGLEKPVIRNEEIVFSSKTGKKFKEMLRHQLFQSSLPAAFIFLICSHKSA